MSGGVGGWRWGPRPTSESAFSRCPYAQASLEGGSKPGKRSRADDGFGGGEEDGEDGDERPGKKQRGDAGAGGKAGGKGAKNGKKEGPGVNKLLEAKRMAAGAKALARRGVSVKEMRQRQKQRSIQQERAAGRGEGGRGGDDGGGDDGDGDGGDGGAGAQPCSAPLRAFFGSRVLLDSSLDSACGGGAFCR